MRSASRRALAVVKLVGMDAISVAIALLLQAQAPEATPPPATSLDRIRRGLDTPPASVTVASSNPDLPTIFRLEIRARPLPYEHLWDQGSVPSYVRPTRPLYHHEFLEQVTPDLFRATSMYPCCPVLPLLAKLVRSGPNKEAEAKARLEVKKELQQLLEARKRAASASQARQQALFATIAKIP